MLAHLKRLLLSLLTEILCLHIHQRLILEFLLRFIRALVIVTVTAVLQLLKLIFFISNSFFGSLFLKLLTGFSEPLVAAAVLKLQQFMFVQFSRLVMSGNCFVLKLSNLYLIFSCLFRTLQFMYIQIS